jgi:DNA-binding GntR family transcriptional regulator
MRRLHRSLPEESVCVLNRGSFVPLYLQIKRWLLDEMESGRWPEGDAIPSEAWIAEQCGVSRMTARQAMNELRMEGRIVRERGRGSFVRLRKRA